MSLPKAYLAGPISGRTYAGATDWREEMRWRLAPEIVGVSPMRGKDYLASMDGGIGGSPDEAYMRNAISSQRGIIGRDRNDVRTADAVLMNLLGADRVSIGTMIEAGWADAWRIPVVLVIEPEGNIHHHVMLDGLVTYRVPSLDEAETLVRVLLNAPRREVKMEYTGKGYLSEFPARFDPAPMRPIPGGGL